MEGKVQYDLGGGPWACWTKCCLPMDLSLLWTRPMVHGLFYGLIIGTSQGPASLVHRGVAGVISALPRPILGGRKWAGFGA